MIAVDTNVLVRIVTNDDPAQAQRAASLLSREQVFIPKTVLLELDWVLRHAYELRPSSVLMAMRRVLGLPNVMAEDPLCVARAFEWYGRGVDLADALHIASSGSAERFFTFDEDLHIKSKTLDDVTVVRI